VRCRKLLSIPAEEIATIGDMPNDVLMFEERRKHRHGQCELRSSGIGYLHHFDKRRRRVCERDREVRMDRTLPRELRAWGTLPRVIRTPEKCEV